jgi:hypothetical protein
MRIKRKRRRSWRRKIDGLTLAVAAAWAWAVWALSAEIGPAEIFAMLLLPTVLWGAGRALVLMPHR